MIIMNRFFTLLFAASCLTAVGQDSTIVVFDFTGSSQTISIPIGVSTLRIHAWGAQGSDGNATYEQASIGGKGAEISGIFNLTQTSISEMTVTVGGQNGFNGGGSGGFGLDNGGFGGNAGNGGGMTSISGLIAGESELLLVVGGGGGGGNHYFNNSLGDGSCVGINDIGGGDGGVFVGGDGNKSVCPEITYSHGGVGEGASQIAGGQGGQGAYDALCDAEGGGASGFIGQLGYGGFGAPGFYNVAGGGGGGGYYGGGGGGSACWGSGRHGSGGGGGSSFWIEQFQVETAQDGSRWGDGRVVITMFFAADIPGCTNSLACNFNSLATADDGSCEFCFCGSGTVWDELTQTCIVDESACGWQPDGNGDNLIGVNDLLDLLGVYGDTDYDQDGIWDSADDCVGEYDECGVCNGGGPSIPIIESIEILYDSVYAEPIDEWLVFEVGADTTFSYTCFEWQCGDPLEYQGYDYETVQIGEQCWFAENLKSKNYLNGDVIPSGFSNAEWNNLSTGASGLFGENQDCGGSHPLVLNCDTVEALTLFGRLYNWYAVNDERALCPSDWHVPSDDEFSELEIFLGLTPEEAEQTGSRGSHAAFLMDFESWSDGNCAPLNSSNFSLIAAGGRDNGGYQYSGNNGYLWSSSEVDMQHAWNRLIFYNDCAVRRQPYYPKERGYSVRCIKDTE